MLIENQNNLNKVDLELNSTQKFETVTRKSNRKQILNVLIGMKHFMQIIMTSLAIHTIVVSLQTAVPHLTKFLTKSHRVIYKRKSKNFNEKEGQKYCH